MNVDRFRQCMAALPEPKTTLRPPFWEAWRLDLWQRVQTQDPARFWEWPCIFHTMLVNHWVTPVGYEFLELNIRLRKATEVPDIGPHDALLGTQLSMNLIHQAYHIQQWEQTTGQRINELSTIVEFGGGYGAMRLLCHRLGFKGKYVIYDLPEFSLLQEYYLSQFEIEAKWNPTRKPKDVDLFMALYSLSEVEPIEREKHFIKAKSYLFLYSGMWEKWDNVLFFQNLGMWFGDQKSMNWQHTELTHLPDRNNWYSIGF